MSEIELGNADRFVRSFDLGRLEGTMTIESDDRRGVVMIYELRGVNVRLAIELAEARKLARALLSAAKMAQAGGPACD